MAVSLCLQKHINNINVSNVSISIMYSCPGAQSTSGCPGQMKLSILQFNLIFFLVFFYRSPAMVYSNDTTNNSKNMQMQSNTSSLPDLSNLSIPSPIHAPIDMEQENSNKAQNQNNHVSPEQPTFQVPFRLSLIHI